jgi:ribosomal-protein-alanine N-acetyltransferase
MSAANDPHSGLFETPRLRLERISEDDAGLLLDVWNDPTFIHFVSDRGIRTDDEARTAIREGTLTLYEHYGYGPYRIVRKTDAANIGICGLFRRDFLDVPDLGYAVLPAFRGEGYASEASRQVLVAAAVVFGLKVVKALVSPRNEASIHVVEKLGFSLEQKLNIERDEETLLFSFDLDTAPVDERRGQ